MKIRPLDVLSFVLLVCLTAVSLLFAKKSLGNKAELIITSSTAEYIYPLEKDGVYKIKGNLGESIIVVKNKKAFFEDSPCPNKTCVACHAISSAGEWTACLPNQVFIRISGSPY